MARITQNLDAFARRFPVDLVAASIFNVFCAVLVTYLMRIGTGFWTNLVFSMCIGLLAQTFIDGGRLLLWGDGPPPKIPFFALLAVSAPAAYFLGSSLAARMLGVPLPELGRGAYHTEGLLILTILACLFGTWMFWSRSKLSELKATAEAEKARAAAIEKQALQAQLHLLQAQIEPHMLFNTLANLKGLIAVDAARAQHMLDQLIDYLRASLTSSRSETTTLAQEFALIRAYLELMAIRMGPRLSYALELPQELHDRRLPPMLLQPLVENAIKHGIEPKIEGGRIVIRAAREAGSLQLAVIDTGLGLEDARPDSAGMGLGTTNVRERLHALYGERASFSLEPNAPCGAIARLSIPL